MQRELIWKHFFQITPRLSFIKVNLPIVLSYVEFAHHPHVNFQCYFLLFRIEYKEYHIDGKILTREDAKEMMRSMKDMVLLQSFISDWKVLSEDETTVVIERGDSEDPTIRRRDQYTFKDGLVIERRCLA